MPGQAGKLPCRIHRDDREPR